MREIKFRAWDTKEEYMYGCPTIQACAYPDGRVSYTTMAFGQRRILMQYTGLKDKNGIEIYEGDIVTSYATDVIGIVKFGNYMAGGEDYYASGAYGFYVQRLFDGKIISEDDTETLGTHNTVIGNIYQNKELLKQ